MTIKKIWLFIAGLFAALVAAFMFEKKQKDDTETKLAIANDSVKDAALKQEQTDNQSAAAKEQARIYALQKSLLDVNVQQMTPEQVAEYWRNKK